MSDDPASPRPRLAALGPPEVLVAGLYAWGATVALPARAAPIGAWLTAAAAALALVGSAPLVRSRPPLARAVGVHGFLALAVATWAQLGSLAWSRLDPVQGALGALAWMLWTVGWGALDRPARAAVGGPVAFPPRVRPSRIPAHALGLAAAGALGLLAKAWTIGSADRALFAHAAALAAGVFALLAGATVAVSLGAHRSGRPRSARARVSAALRPLALAAALVAAALAATFLR